MNWFGLGKRPRSIDLPRVPITCPRCKMLGAESRGPMVVPFVDGSEREIGRLYGCPHCGLAWFLQDGVVREFGYLRPREGNDPPPGSRLTPAGRRTDGALPADREKQPLGDQDLRWQRRQ